ncbi:hypothetical protein BV20DRAFT_962735 [Pilatotrama ljubarskyi]|nr:hypothetical protein BV20DRAFT_962735 [Pilatotrama ljubarskyi]
MPSSTGLSFVVLLLQSAPKIRSVDSPSKGASESTPEDFWRSRHLHAPLTPFVGLYKPTVPPYRNPKHGRPWGK